jgi:hypothetical protein
MEWVLVEKCCLYLTINKQTTMQEQVYTVRVTADATEWFNERGQRHRIDGPAIEYASGTKYWYQNGQRHHIDGPAVEYADGEKYWYQNGFIHRIDGPAIERANGDKQWYINGENLSETEFLARTQSRELTMDEIAQRFGIPVELLKIKKG